MTGCIHTRFQEQVRKFGDRVGIVCGTAHMTYRELERRSTELAARLQAQGLETEGRVALLLPRSLDLAIGILAVLRGGGAYVPIDVSLPQKRIDYLLADSAPTLILTIRKFAYEAARRRPPSITGLAHGNASNR